MIILLEGQNGVGKSTIARKLCERYGLVYQKENRFKYDMGKSYEPYMQMSLNLNDGTLQDRWHLGECVYPFIKNDGRPGLNCWQQHAIERVLANKGCLLIFCTASPDFIKVTYKNRGEDFITEDQVPFEGNLFSSCFSQSILPKWRYHNEIGKDFSFDILDEVVVKIEDQRKKLEPFHSSHIFYNVLQPNNFPVVMLVGERFNKHHGDEKHAFSGYQKGCSNYLHEALFLTKLSDLFYLTNIHKTENNFEQDSILFHHEFNLVKPHKVIALGKIASKSLNLMGVSHDILPHPQYWKRFHNHEIVAYAKMIYDKVLGGY